MQTKKTTLLSGLSFTMVETRGSNPDLLTASQALSQLSYAPVTRRYYRGMFYLMQEGILVAFIAYGFSNSSAVPIKP